MSQNGQTHFKNLAAFAARFLNVSDHFGTLCIKGLNYGYIKTYRMWYNDSFWLVEIFLEILKLGHI